VGSPLPHVPTLAITKDPQICDPTSHKTRDLERIIVGSQGGVANTVVFLKYISSGKAMDIRRRGNSSTSGIAATNRTFYWCPEMRL